MWCLNLFKQLAYGAARKRIVLQEQFLSTQTAFMTCRNEESKLGLRAANFVLK